MKKIDKCKSLKANANIKEYYEAAYGNILAE